MGKFSFEYRIVLAYLAVGGLWILFSDQILQLFAAEADWEITRMQTFKGLFYVIITALLFFLFLKRHLKNLRNTEQELENHKDNLEMLVREKTKELDAAIEELRGTNEELKTKNEIINKQNAELKEAMDHLQSAQTQLIQTEKMASLGVLTSGVAHEINNPLNFILGGLTGLESSLQQEEWDANKTQLFLESIRNGIDRVNSIVTGLNQLSRKDELPDENCDLQTVIDNCLSIIHYQLIDRITITKDYQGSANVQGNTGQLHQAFLNILLNAVQAIEGDGTIAISLEVKGDTVQVSINDTGRGISEENILRVTDPFFTTRNPGEGTGLGLAIVHNIIRAHHGEISFSSEQKQGATVIVVLPIVNLNHD
ncbi:MAG: ATP-binding protein [Bacteroidales bacterium]